MCKNKFAERPQLLYAARRWLEIFSQENFRLERAVSYFTTTTIPKAETAE